MNFSWTTKWICNILASNGNYLIEDKYSGKAIAEVYNKEDVPLIRFAPELLKALKEITTAFYNEEPKDFHHKRGSYFDSIKKLYSQKIEAAERAIEIAEQPIT